MKALHTKKRDQRGGYSLSVAISVAIKPGSRSSPGEQEASVNLRPVMRGPEPPAYPPPAH